MRVAVVVFALLLATPLATAAYPIELREENRWRGSYAPPCGRITLEIDRDVLRPGERLNATARFEDCGRQAYTTWGPACPGLDVGVVVDGILQMPRDGPAGRTFCPEWIHFFTIAPGAVLRRDASWDGTSSASSMALQVSRPGAIACRLDLVRAIMYFERDWAQTNRSLLVTDD